MEDESGFRTVATARPAAPYMGGKRRLAETLAARIAAVPHATYVEPFVGMGGVFLRRRRAPRLEVINDVSGDVATFGAFAQDVVEVTYTISDAAAARVRELIVASPGLPRPPEPGKGLFDE